MATKGAEAAAHDTSDSDDSMEQGRRPSFSTGRRILPEELLENSKKFMKFYREHLPHLQQTIGQLFRNTVFYIDRVIADSQSGVGGFAARLLGVGQNLSAEDILLGPSTSFSFYRLGSGEDKQHRNRDELLKQAERAVETFQTTTGNANIHLKNICKDVEEILKYQRDEQSTSLRYDLENLREEEYVLKEMAELFEVHKIDLERIKEQAYQNVRNTEDLNFLLRGVIRLLNLIIGLLSENYKTLRDFDELKDHSTVQESDLKTEAGKVVLEIRETLNNLLKTLNGVMASKPRIETVLIPKLEQYFYIRWMFRKINEERRRRREEADALRRLIYDDSRITPGNL